MSVPAGVVGPVRRLVSIGCSTTLLMTSHDIVRMS
jgi:hypothetical protein